MPSSKQCEAARLITKSTNSDLQINQEYSSLTPVTKEKAANAIDKLLVLHDLPFDQGWIIMTEDFLSISASFNICPATLFCVYMDSKK